MIRACLTPEIPFFASGVFDSFEKSRKNFENDLKIKVNFACYFHGEVFKFNSSFVNENKNNEFNVFNTDFY